MTAMSNLLTLIREHALGFYIFDAVRYLVAAFGMAAIVLWMRHARSPRRIQARQPTRNDYVREFATSMRTVGIFAASGLLTIWAERQGWLAVPSAHTTPLALIGAVIALLLWHDTWFYWTHRAMHDPRLFRTMHRTHHRSVTPTPFAAYAFDSSEAVVQSAFLPIWLLVVPVPHIAIFIFLAIMIIRNVMGHAGFELMPRGWVDQPLLGWINTTVHHDLHHSGGFNSNYGLYFTWWDRICGTEHPDYRARFRALTAGHADVSADTGAAAQRF
jgi:sterol desaturase/sphingolipid hydroxylase (fatty acid hydroxylase superfamily)